MATRRIHFEIFVIEWKLKITWEEKIKKRLNTRWEIQNWKVKRQNFKMLKISNFLQ